MLEKMDLNNNLQKKIIQVYQIKIHVIFRIFKKKCTDSFLKSSLKIQIL